MQFIWWAAISGSLLLVFLDAIVDGIDEDRDYDAMHFRMKLAIYLIIIGIAAKATKFLA